MAKPILQISGFDEMIKKLESTSKAAEQIGKKTAQDCGAILKAEIVDQAKSAGLPDKLIKQIDEDFEAESASGKFRYLVGWRKVEHTRGAPLTDSEKVIIANYGTPERFTNAGASRGEIKKLNFLKKAKAKAKLKIKRRIESGFAELNKELEK
ncbi:MAG: hypothetical protein IKU08_09275 [Clostridia bacterium]|nr:hypothetical protein [Clostridia bacterium]